MSVSLGDFYGRRLPSKAQLRRMEESNAQVYRPNESLTNRRDLQVSLAMSDVEDEFEDSQNSSGPPFTSTSTPIQSREVRTSSFCSPESSRPGYSAGVLGILQEQQCLLQKLLHEQQEMTKLVKKNDKRISSIESELKQRADSSCSSAGEKKRFITKDLTVS